MDDPNWVPDHLYVPGPNSPKTSHGFTRRQLAMGKCPQDQLSMHQLACMRVEMQGQLIQKLHGGHARTFWDAPDKAKFLTEVLKEREPEYNSEDDTGRPIWNKHKCPKYKEEYAKMEKVALEKRDRIIKENIERAKDLINNYEIPIWDLPWVPNKKEQYRLDDIALGLKNSYENLQEHKRLKFQLPRATDYISNHDSTSFFCPAQLNISMINYIHSKEKRIEFGILGQRERRRYNQAKDLGFHIPFTYKKIWKIFNCDFYASNFMLKYPHVITDDSEYEDDEEVKKKDPKEITKYIMKGSQRNRDHLEMKGIQRRMIAARMKVGHYPMDEPMIHIVYQAQDEFLHRHGTEKGFTETKRLGLYKRNPLLDNLPYFDAGYHLQLMFVIERWLTKYPNIFVHFKYLIDFVLARMGNDFTFMPLFPHVVLGMFKHREHDVPKCLRSPDWKEQVILARKRYAQENDPDRQINPGLPQWTFKNICPWEKNELVLSQMIYKKLGIDPFRDVMNHDPKVIEEQVSQMDFTELIKEFYDEEKKQLPEFTATIFKELERRERIGLHLKIQTTTVHIEHPLATNDFPGRIDIENFVERFKVLQIRRSYYEDRGKTHPDSSQWIRTPIEIEYLRKKAEREHRLEYFPQTLIEDEKRISIMSLNQQKEEFSRRLSQNSKSEQKLSSEQYAQSEHSYRVSPHSYRVSSIEEEGSNNQYETAQKSLIRNITSNKPSSSSSKRSEQAQLEEQKFMSEFGADPDQTEIQKMINSEEEKRAQIMEVILDQSSEINSEQRDHNIILKMKKTYKKITNVNQEPSYDEKDKKKKKRPKLYRQIVEILKERCSSIDAKQYFEDFAADFKQTRKLTRRELNPKEKWDQLGSSAEDSDNSLLHTTYNDDFLGAKQKQLLQKGEPQKKLKKERVANEIVDIDGKRQQWGTFKKIFEEDIKLRKIKGEEIEEAKFLLNKDDPKKEKILTWNTHYGFVSENSDDENTNFLRVQRKLMKERQEQHSESFLRERKVRPFESLMLLLGGKQIFESYLGKSIEIAEISTVLDWQDPQKLPFFQFGNFFMVESQEVLDLFYNAERNMQEKLAGEEIASKSIFVNELIQLYLLFMQVLKDNQEQWARKLLQILPKSFRAYQWDYNLYGFNEFKSLSKESGKKISSLSIRSNESLQIQRHEDQSVKSFADEAELEDSLSKKKIRKSSYNGTLQDEPMFDYFSQDQSQVVGEDYDMVDEVVQFPNNQSPVQELSQRLSEELSIKQHLKLSSVKQSAPQTQQFQAQIKQDKVASFYVPPSNKPNYQELKRQMIGYQKASYESDAKETALLISNHQLIDPVQIQDVLLPQLEEIVQNSDGRLERVFIWPSHRVEGNALAHPNERRYPKRLKEFEPKHEDTPIYVRGVEIGYMVSKIPFLKAQVWGGYGVPLSNKVFQEQTHPNLNVSSNGQQHKKRKMDALNLGAGLSSYQKEEGMHKIEEALPFMRTVGQRNCTFDLLKIDETHESGTQYQIQLALPQGQSIQQRAPMTKKITIESQMPLTTQALYLSTVEMTALGQNKTNSRHIYTQALVTPGQIWILTNQSDQTLYININLKKDEQQ